MRGRIFISYRRDDAPGDARGICDRLVRKFGKSNVFMDVDNLLAGQRFDRELDKALAQCDVLIAILGPRWMELLSRPEGHRDFVRDEIAAALKREIVVIPVLVGREGRMPMLPQSPDLPEELRELVLYQKHSVAHETFGRDTDELIAAINAVLSGRRAPRSMMPWVAGGAVALAAAIVLLVYQFGRVSKPQPASTSAVIEQAPADADTRRKAEAEAARSNAEQVKKAADEDARKRAEQVAAARAVEEAKKKRDQEELDRAMNEAKRRAEQSAKNVGIQCDLLAAAPNDRDRPENIMGVFFKDIEAEDARAACDGAVADSPRVVRFLFQAGRAADAGGDYQRAMMLYRDASDRGSAAAMNGVGELFRDGQGVAQDYAAARAWFIKAADLRDPLAIRNLGDLYENGRGVPRDYVRARQLYEQAAALNGAEGMFNLGLMWERGLGGRKGEGEALGWYMRAAAAGLQAAREKLRNSK